MDRNTVRLIILSVIALLSTLTTCVAMAQELSCKSLSNLSPSQLLSEFEPIENTSWLRHGTGCYSEGGNGKKGCDWETTITLDKAMGRERWLIIASSTHHTGSGSWDYVVVFACGATPVRVVLAEKFLYGVHIESLSDQRLVLEAGYWEPNDPTCCPSATSHQTYEWDQETQEFKRTELHEARKKSHL